MLQELLAGGGRLFIVTLSLEFLMSPPNVIDAEAPKWRDEPVSCLGMSVNH